MGAEEFGQIHLRLLGESAAVGSLAGRERPWANRNYSYCTTIDEVGPPLRVVQLRTYLCLWTRINEEGNESSDAKYFFNLVRKLTELFR